LRNPLDQSDTRTKEPSPVKVVEPPKPKVAKVAPSITIIRGTDVGAATQKTAVNN
jgi:hypothetical protein